MKAALACAGGGSASAEVSSSQRNDGILRRRHGRVSLFTPEWSVSFDHRIVLLKILSVLELSGAAQVETEFSPRTRRPIKKKKEKKKGVRPRARVTPGSRSGTCVFNRGTSRASAKVGRSAAPRPFRGHVKTA